MTPTPPDEYDRPPLTDDEYLYLSGITEEGYTVDDAGHPRELNDEDSAQAGQAIRDLLRRAQRAEEERDRLRSDWLALSSDTAAWQQRAEEAESAVQQVRDAQGPDLESAIHAIGDYSGASLPFIFALRRATDPKETP